MGYQWCVLQVMFFCFLKKHTYSTTLGVQVLPLSLSLRYVLHVPIDTLVTLLPLLSVLFAGFQG